ncbi:hypothetical protein BOV94_12900 [Solemya velum gill symbiont]|nr:hypothetical protein BOV94_12900 [Solemya velum gill symbiont]
MKNLCPNSTAVSREVGGSLNSTRENPVPIGKKNKKLNQKKKAISRKRKVQSSTSQPKRGRKTKSSKKKSKKSQKKNLKRKIQSPHNFNIFNKKRRI